MTHTLSLSGFELPEHLMPPNASNVTGYWEPQEVADFNERLLATLDSRWNDPFGPDLRLLCDDQLEALTDGAADLLRRNFGEAPRIVLKEPRINLLGDVWMPALQRCGFSVRTVVMVRRPAEVALSLKRRDGMPVTFATMVWANNMLRADAVSAATPRCFVSYDALRADPEATLDRISSQCRVELPRRTWSSYLEIEAFLREDLKHEVAADPLAGVDPRFQRLYGHYARLCGDRPSEDLGAVSDVRGWLAEMEGVAMPIVRSLRSAAA